MGVASRIVRIILSICIMKSKSWRNTGRSWRKKRRNCWERSRGLSRIRKKTIASIGWSTMKNIARRAVVGPNISTNMSRKQKDTILTDLGRKLLSKHWILSNRPFWEKTPWVPWQNLYPKIVRVWRNILSRRYLKVLKGLMIRTVHLVNWARGSRNWGRGWNERWRQWRRHKLPLQLLRIRRSWRKWYHSKRCNWQTSSKI